MNFSIPIGKIAGIPIRLHGLFVLFAVLWTLPYAFAGGRVQPWPFIIFGILFGSVVLHELGHALVARRFGAGIVDIVLWPLGGFTRMTRMPEASKPEFLVAIAGPMVNITLMCIAFALGGNIYIPGLDMWFPNVPKDMHPIFSPEETPVDRMAWINAVLGFSNLIPAFPMDGGRALRAIFTARTGYLRATELAVRIGRWFLVLAVVAAFYYSSSKWIYVFIALFLWWQGSAELAAVRLRYGINPLQAMMAKMFGAAAGNVNTGNDQNMDELYQRARRQQETKRDDSGGDINRDLESYRGSLDEYFRERKRRENES